MYSKFLLIVIIASSSCYGIDLDLPLDAGEDAVIAKCRQLKRYYHPDNVHGHRNLEIFLQVNLTCAKALEDFKRHEKAQNKSIESIEIPSSKNESLTNNQPYNNYDTIIYSGSAVMAILVIAYLMAEFRG